jgi:sulfopropanediol 3-dehydrogenase
VATYLKQPKDPAPVNRHVRETVSEMLATIERDRETAVRDYSARLDDWSPDSFVLTAEDVAQAADAVPDDLKHHIGVALRQVRGFATAQRETLRDLEVELSPGIVLGHRFVPVDRVGAYVPGGLYQMFGSSFMTVAVAKVAGVAEITASAPPFNGGRMKPLMLYAIATSGADRVLCLGGVQALATLAFGLFELEPIDMLVGAGNAYVAEAKRQLFGRVGIDLLAGPTEVLVLADASADAQLVAIDLLAQAEHGPTSPTVLVTTSESLARDVLIETDRLLEGGWPTADVARVSWGDYGAVIIAESDQEAVDIANQMAPEHLEVQVEAEKLSWFEASLRNYGSLFVGDESTVAYGDKGVGTNHVLPTARNARFTGGLWVGAFLKMLTSQRITPEGTRFIAPTISAIAEAEGMFGHALSADVRLERLAAERPLEVGS